MDIRNRIKELRNVRATELKPSARTWRTHPRAQQDALRGVLAEIGFADAVLDRELEDGSLELIDGHLRTEVMGRHGSGARLGRERGGSRAAAGHAGSPGGHGGGGPCQSWTNCSNR